jgi:hypothetical protein
MTNAIAQLSAAVAPAASILPEGLKAKVEVLVKVDAFDLMKFLGTCYGAKGCELLEVGNDTHLSVDVREISNFDREYTDRDELLASLRKGGVEDYNLRGVMVLAVMDGHLPAAKYLVSVSW